MVSLWRRFPACGAHVRVVLVLVATLQLKNEQKTGKKKRVCKYKSTCVNDMATSRRQTYFS